MHTYIHTRTHTYIHTYKQQHTHTHTHTHIIIIRADARLPARTHARPYASTRCPILACIQRQSRHACARAGAHACCVCTGVECVRSRIAYAARPSMPVYLVAEHARRDRPRTLFFFRQSLGAGGWWVVVGGHTTRWEPLCRACACACTTHAPRSACSINHAFGRARAAGCEGNECACASMRVELFYTGDWRVPARARG